MWPPQPIAHQWAQPLAPRIEQLAQPCTAPTGNQPMGFWGFLDEQLQPYPCMDVFEWSIAVLESCQCQWLANWFLQKSLKSKERDRDVFQHLHIIMKNQFGNMYSWTFVMLATSQFNPHPSHVFASLPSPSGHLQTPTYSSLSKADQCKQYQRCTSGTSWGALAVTRFNTRCRKLLLLSYSHNYTILYIVIPYVHSLLCISILISLSAVHLISVSKSLFKKKWR